MGLSLGRQPVLEKEGAKEQAQSVSVSAHLRLPRSSRGHLQLPPQLPALLSLLTRGREGQPHVLPLTSPVGPLRSRRPTLLLSTLPACHLSSTHTRNASADSSDPEGRAHPTTGSIHWVHRLLHPGNTPATFLLCLGGPPTPPWIAGTWDSSAQTPACCS